MRKVCLAAAAVAMVAVAAPAADAKPLKAKIQRTKYGVPHITAKNIKSLAAGFAYAFAQDNICTIAAEYVTVERASARASSARTRRGSSRATAPPTGTSTPTSTSSG